MAAGNGSQRTWPPMWWKAPWSPLRAQPTPGFQVPGPPQNVVATPGNTQVTVTWAAPLNPGDSAITSYTVTASPGGASTTVNAPALTAIVTGLTNGVAYTFTVVATSSAGTSLPTPAPFPSQLRVQGRNLIDASGHVMSTLNGFNAQIVPQWTSQGQWANMAAEGARIVRHVIFWNWLQTNALGGTGGLTGTGIAAVDNQGIDTAQLAVLDAQVLAATQAGLYSQFNLYYGPTPDVPSWVPTGTFTDGVANGTSLFTSQAANFVASDKGLTFTSSSVAGGTTILAVQNEHTVTLSANATTGSGITFTVGLLPTNQYAHYGQAITQCLANRYGNPKSPQYTTAVLGFGLNEPENAYPDYIPNMEEMYRGMISWIRAYAPNWIGFVTYGYASGTPIYNDPGWTGTAQDAKTSADPKAYDSVGGNVIIDFHDYFWQIEPAGTPANGVPVTSPLAEMRNTNGLTNNALFTGANDTAYVSNATIIAQHQLYVEPYKVFCNNAQLPLMIGEFSWVPTATGGVDWMKDVEPIWIDAGAAIEIWWDFNTTIDTAQDPWAAYPGQNWLPIVNQWMISNATNVATPVAPILPVAFYVPTQEPPWTRIPGSWLGRNALDGFASGTAGPAALTGATSDAANGTDSAVRSALTSARTTTDTGAGSDAATRLVVEPRTAGDSAAGSDTAVRSAITRTRTTADAGAGTDIAARGTLAPTRTAADTAAGSDTAVGAPSRARITADVANGSDSTPRGALTPVRTTADAAAGSDAAARLQADVRAATDAAGGSDAASRVSAESRTTADTANGTASSSRLVADTRSSSDTAAGSDTVSRTATHPRTTTDTGNGTDAAVKGAAGGKTTADLAAGSDVAARSGVTFVRTTSDAAAGADAAIGVRALIRTAGDTASGSDVSARTTAMSRVSADTAAGSDTAARQAARPRVAADSAAGVDGLTEVLHLFRNLSDLGGGTDTAAGIPLRARSASDVGAGTDLPTIRRVFARTVGDIAAGTDTAGRIILPLGRVAVDVAAGTDIAVGLRIQSANEAVVIVAAAPATKIVVQQLTAAVVVQQPAAQVVVTSRPRALTVILH